MWWVSEGKDTRWKLPAESDTPSHRGAEQADSSPTPDVPFFETSRAPVEKADEAPTVGDLLFELGVALSIILGLCLVGRGPLGCLRRCKSLTPILVNQGYRLLLIQVKNAAHGDVEYPQELEARADEKFRRLRMRGYLCPSRDLYGIYMTKRPTHPYRVATSGSKSIRVRSFKLKDGKGRSRCLT